MYLLIKKNVTANSVINYKKNAKFTDPLNIKSDSISLKPTLIYYFTS